MDAVVSQSEKMPPSYYNDLGLSLACAWSLLISGGQDRHTGFHALTVASVENNTPRLRTMILREANEFSRTLRFHSDARSSKFAQISQNSHVAVSHYDAACKIELRIRGVGKWHQQDELSQRAWNDMRDISRFGYRSPKAPGALISSVDEYLRPDSHSVTRDDVIAQQNFCVLIVHVQELEWIYLHSQGNRRARFTWPQGALVSNWIQH